MVNANASIYAIIMNCDETIKEIDLGNSYSIKKIYFDDLPFKNEIVNGKGMIDSDYIPSQLRDKAGNYFMCLHKLDRFEISEPQLWVKTEKGYAITDSSINTEIPELSNYTNDVSEYLNKAMNLLHIYQKGNIGIRKIFIKYQVDGLVHHNRNINVDMKSRNTCDVRKFILDINGIVKCDEFLKKYSDIKFEVLKQCIDEFVWGLEQLDIPTGFEQYTTALEMILLEQNEQAKKQKLANRVSVLIADSSAEMMSIQANMIKYYRFRSESLHDGDGSSITKDELEELEEITRKVIKKTLEYTNDLFTTNQNISFHEIKSNLISDIKADVQTNKDNGNIV